MQKLSKVEDLLKDIPGAVGVGEFSDDGKLLFYTDNLKEQAAEYSAMLCATIKQLASTMAKGWDMYSGQEGFYPILGFAVGCGKYVAMVMGNVAVFAELEKADLDKTFEIMSNYV
ncbi:MAG: DUF2173 family protein [Aquificaceae bacterium]|nr:DUF2173 family protein [Aquificaceae bacterium]MDW8422710.1 DUF2173 family protein [Aquificaceae bacterium]